MFAMAPWEKSMAYSDDGETEAEAQRKDEVLKSFFARTAALLKKFDPIHTRRPMRWLVRHLISSLADDTHTHIHICTGERLSTYQGALCSRIPLVGTQVPAGGQEAPGSIWLLAFLL